MSDRFQLLNSATTGKRPKRSQRIRLTPAVISEITGPTTFDPFTGPPKPISPAPLSAPDLSPIPDDNDRAAYIPTLEQIAAECKLIQASWSDEENWRRHVGVLPDETDGGNSDAVDIASYFRPRVRRRRR